MTARMSLFRHMSGLCHRKLAAAVRRHMLARSCRWLQHTSPQYCLGTSPGSTMQEVQKWHLKPVHLHQQLAEHSLAHACAPVLPGAPLAAAGGQPVQLIKEYHGRCSSSCPAASAYCCVLCLGMSHAAHTVLTLLLQRQPQQAPGCRFTACQLAHAMRGRACLANRLAIAFSLSPTYLEKSSAPFTARKLRPDSEATALASIVLLQPGGPKSSTPRGACIHGSQLAVERHGDEPHLSFVQTMSYAVSDRRPHL